MGNMSHFRRVVTPGVNLVLGKFKKMSHRGDAIKVFWQGIVPWKAMYPNFVVVMTTKCSLKCRNCNNLMPHYKEPYDVPAKDVIADIEGITKNIDTCVNLSLIGGEPFVYQELGEVLDAVIANDKIMFVNLTSNGTIIPKKEIMEKLRNPKIMVMFSDYGIKTQKINEVKKAFSEYGIRYDYKKDLTWISPGGVEKRGKTVEKLKKEYSDCFSAKYCKTILRGRIYSCSRSAHLHDLGYMNDAQDYFEIHKNRDQKTFRKEFKDFYMRDYAEACNYCDHALGKEITPGEQCIGNNIFEE